MNLRMSVAVSMEILTAHKLRTLLSVSGSVVGVASVVVMIAVGLGTKCEIHEKVQSLGSNLMVVVAGQMRVSGGKIRRASVSKTLTPADARAIATMCPSVERAAGAMKQSIMIQYRGKSVKTRLTGMDPDGFAIRNIRIDRGRLFTKDEERLKRRVVVFAPTAAKNTFGDIFIPGQPIRLAGQPFRTIGRIASKGTDLSGSDQDDEIFVPLSTAMKRLVNVDTIDSIFIRLRDGFSFEKAGAEIRQILRKRHRLENRADDFSIFSQLDMAKLQEETSRTLSTAVISLVALSWIVGGIGIFSVMLMSVRQRRSEIGLRRALGARAKDIRFQFILESALIAAAGGITGLSLGITGIWMINATGWAPAVLPWLSAAGALAASVLLGLLTGLYPAMRAARLAPATALNGS